MDNFKFCRLETYTIVIDQVNRIDYLRQKSWVHLAAATMDRFPQIRSMVSNFLAKEVTLSQSDIYSHVLSILESPTQAQEVVQNLGPRGAQLMMDFLFFLSRNISETRKWESLGKPSGIINNLNNGGIVVSHHFFSISAMIHLMRFLNIPASVVAAESKEMEPFWRLVRSYGFNLLMYDSKKFQRGLAKEIQGRLKRNEVVVFLTDWFFSSQFPKLPFYNRYVHVATGPAFFSQLCQVPIYFLPYHRLAGGAPRFEFNLQTVPVVHSPKKSDAIIEITQYLHHNMQTHIHRYPDQWMYWSTTGIQRFYSLEP